MRTAAVWVPAETLNEGLENEKRETSRLGGLLPESAAAEKLAGVKVLGGMSRFGSRSEVICSRPLVGQSGPLVAKCSR